MKVVYLWNDGTPVIVEKNLDGEYIYPEKKYTETPPPEGIYAPFYYDGQKWVGQSKEEFEKSLAENTEPTVDPKDEIIADLTMQLAATQTEVSELKNDFANLALIVGNLNGGSANG